MHKEVEIHKSSETIMLKMTEAACEHAKKYISKREQCQGLRFSLKKAGCSGLTYVLDFVDQLDSQDIVCRIDTDITIYIDPKSYPNLLGTTIDFVQDGLNHKYAFYNPNAKGECGCGESIHV